jgi:sensor histidine kinase YesM
VPGAIAISTQGTGTGIKNIKQRLDLLYGEFANLSVESLANNFTVYLIIPMEKMS